MIEEMKRMKEKLQFVIAVVGFMAMSSSAALAGPRPDLYPNAHLQKVGQTRANQDIANCQVKAEDYIGDTSAQRQQQNVHNTVRKGARGAALGALAGSITGGNAGRAAGAGAAVGAASSVLDNRRQQRDQELNGSPEYRSYVSACLEDLGYKVVGWR